MTKLILPDNNIFSEFIRIDANPKVVQKYGEHLNHFGMAITVWHELLYGLYHMPNGRRKDVIAQFIYQDLARLHKYHYTAECAEIHAVIRAECRKKGQTLSFADSQIASIAIAHDAILITRNIKDFKAIDGLKIENWFD